MFGELENSERSQAAIDWDAARLAETALIGEPRKSIGTLLESVAKACGSLGCLLWRASSDTDYQASPPVGRMSMLAGWFQTTRSPQLLAIHHLPLTGTVAGKAVCTQKPFWSNNMVNDGVKNAELPFFKEHNVTRTLAVPIIYPSGRVGAVNVYRRATSPEYCATDGKLLLHMATLLPHLYRAARQRASFELIRDVGKILRGYRRPVTMSLASERQLKVLEELCTALQNMFQAVEVSIFLETDDALGVYKCAFTTEGPHATATRVRDYRASCKEGFSGLALSTGECIRIYDTQDCEEEVEEYRKRYEEFAGHKSKGVSKEVNVWLKVPKGWKPQPHSLMVVPLRTGQQDGANQKTHGFLRCWIAKAGPPYFSLDDLELLQLVAEHFTHAVESWREEQGIFASLSKAQTDASTARENAMRAELEKVQLERESRVQLEDIHHQMKGPLAEAERRVSKLLDLRRAIPASELFAVRSMLHRASLMSKKIGLLAKLERGDRIALRTSPVEARELVLIVGEIAMNNQFRISEKRNIQIEADTDTLFRNMPLDLLADLELITEALNNLVDNAAKYSYPNTKIQISSGISRGGRFYISVTNVGIPIRPHEVRHCRERSWRGEIAKTSAGEGNGIGLWVVDHIMRAHGGELEVIPTRENDGVTEVRLILKALR